jgi:rhodanese-related sulfurtransferase
MQPDVSPLETLATLARADAPRLLDIRIDEDVASFPGLIPGAIPVAYDDIDRQNALATGRGAIVICHKGLKLSSGVVARLRLRDHRACGLRGGQKAWVAAQLPLCHAPAPTALALPRDALPVEAAMAWAMLRFSAPMAELLVVPRDDVPGVVAMFGAVAPAEADLPDLPGLASLLADIADPRSLFAAQLAGTTHGPADVFPCLDAAYRGRLAQLALDRAAPPDQTHAVSALQEEARL